ncbi:MAG: hypothetical protein JW967_11080 [Dehalococcoidales bacterium]|nr:hypothetical protein [Dehalococcoidales bacterium]
MGELDLDNIERLFTIDWQGDPATSTFETNERPQVSAADKENSYGCCEPK